MKNNDNLLLKYAGFATQLLVGLGLAVYLGLKTDSWLHFKTPLAVWIFPLIIIIALIYKAVKDTAPKK